MSLKSKTPRGCANELKKYLVEKLGKEVESSIIIRSPKENYDGDCWTLIFEGGPFEWPIALVGGSCMFAWEFGQYSKAGYFPEGLSNEFVSCEPQNHYQVNFYKQ